MKVVELNLADGTDPVWDDVRLRGCDFRPHFDGYLYNLFTTIHPLESKSDTERFFCTIACEIANWVLSNRKRFGRGDRFQIIVGWPLDIRPTSRQVIKIGGGFDELRHLINDPDLIQVRNGWSATVFPCAADG